MSQAKQVSRWDTAKATVTGEPLLRKEDVDREINAKNQEIRNLNTQVADLQRQAETDRKTIADLQKKIKDDDEAHKKVVEDLQAQIEARDNTIRGLRTQIDGLNTQIGGLREQLRQQETRQKQYEERTDARLDEIERNQQRNPMPPRAAAPPQRQTGMYF